MKPWKRNEVLLQIRELEGSLQCAQSFVRAGQGGQNTVERITREIAALKAKL